MLSSSKLKLSWHKDFLRATYTAKQIEIRITFRCTEWGEFNPCVKKSQKKHKIWNGNTTTPIITSAMVPLIDFTLLLGIIT